MLLSFLLEKEFRQMLHDAFVPRLIVMMPLMTMLIFPLAANMDVKHVTLTMVDHDHSSLSQRLEGKLRASDYFRVTDRPAQSSAQALEEIEKGRADMSVELPAHLERDLMSGRGGEVKVEANAVNGVKGGLGTSYLGGVMQSLMSEIGQERGQQLAQPSIMPVTHFRYNEGLDYRPFMLPAFLVMLLTIIGGFLPALNIVSEKERGTIEQINVSPVPRSVFILAKLIPYWMVEMVVFSLCLVLMWAVWGVVPQGSLLLVYGVALVYTLAISGLGLVVSNYSDTVQQAMFVMFFCMMIFMLMSGLFTPISSMPDWAQWLSRLNPLRYLVETMRGLFMRGCGLRDIMMNLMTLAAFALVFFAGAVRSYKKSS